ncbi:60S ribosomal protein L18a-like protein isoform X2 [Punica granatum]|uniref:60S ribosomal protein L18a-like protein isoform X2 n=1 Tax=Punica granatum TaxID=22663 RepID=A0A6P8D3I7_PUNGR|nr:60S ribosomal protein L18a-like protein isoform X2 [Punica granatum]XP_031388998.1 60S ribosomal protein L18a-like protein isoform X2 [Punica granatum]XP_031388999.1 60S ribosomal protein L18a-like protein isoform X2 [Punica granatum]
MDQKHSNVGVDQEKGDYTPLKDEEDPKLGLYDKPLPCFGCGIGWFSLVLGFVFPVMWYFATILYFCNYYQKDPRERAGLAASAIAAMICTVAIIIAAAVIMSG